MRTVLCITLILLLPATLTADVVASVDDVSLTWDEIVQMIGGEQNVPYLGITTEAAAIGVLEAWVNEEVLIQAAENSGIASDPEVQYMIEQTRRQILLEAYMAEVVGDLQPSQLEIENYASEWLSTYKKRAHVRHILVDDVNLANSILARVNAGTDFASLAMQYSIGPSGPGGGDLGWITRGQSGYMKFDEAAFSLDAGETSGVVETGAGYHIIRVEETELLSPEPNMEDIMQIVAIELTQAMQEEALMDKVDELVPSHDIQLYPERLLEHIQ